MTDLNKFIKDCIRTESKIEKVSLEKETFTNLCLLYLHLTEIFDGYKKFIFYNKEEKLKKEFADRINHISNLAKKLNRNNTLRTDVENVDPRVLHGIIGIMTESGELCDILTNLLLDPLAKIDPIHVQEELGDGMASGWYPAILHDALGLNPDETHDKVIRKLKIRFPEGYSDEKAANRDLANERKELER